MRRGGRLTRKQNLIPVVSTFTPSISAYFKKLIPAFHSRHIILIARPREGTRTGCTVRGVRAGARGRERSRLTLPGGAGAPPGGTTTPCEELADGGRQCPSESAARRRMNAGRRAERRHAAARSRAHKARSRLLARRPPRLFGEGHLDRPRALARRENDGACLKCNTKAAPHIRRSCPGLTRASMMMRRSGQT